MIRIENNCQFLEDKPFHSVIQEYIYWLATNSFLCCERIFRLLQNERNPSVKNQEIKAIKNCQYEKNR